LLTVRLLPQEDIPTRLVEPEDRPPLRIVEARAPSRFTLLRIFATFLRWLFTILWLRVPRRLTTEEYARRLRQFLESMGGLWIKAGQLLSLRRDLFSTQFCDELSKLLDHSDGFPFHMVRQTIEEDLGGKLEDHFDEFIEQPFAAASIGQLHMAHLRREQGWVAIKVQRPYIIENFQYQLTFIRILFNLIERLQIVQHLRPREIISELVYVMGEELDYRIEGSNIRRMRKTLRRHKIYVPNVFLRYSSRRILVMEYIQGVLITDYIKVLQSDPQRIALWERENNVDSRKAGTRLYYSLMRQVIEDNLFHGDLHPGNIVMLRNSRLAFIDFGTIGFMETEYLKKYSSFLQALAEREYSKAIDLLFLLSASLPEIDTAEVKEKLIRAIRAWETRTLTKALPYREKSLSNLHQDILRVMYQYQVPSTWLFLKLERTNLTVDASLMHLYPDMNYPLLIRKYFHQASEREIRKRQFSQLTPQALMGLVSALGTIPEMIDEYKVFQAPVIRRHAQLYQGGVTKVHYLLFVIFRDGVRLTFVAGVYLSLVFLQQRFPETIEPLTGSLLRGIGDTLPRYSDSGWALVFFILVYVHRNLRNMKNRLGEREVRLPQEPR
jgi:ubiquinone biosynthesis protein